MQLTRFEFMTKDWLSVMNRLYYLTMISGRGKAEGRPRTKRPPCPVTPEQFLEMRCQALAEIEKEKARAISLRKEHGEMRK